MNLQDKIEGIESREDLSRFIDEMRSSFNNKEWHNRDLPSYLEAMSAWIMDMDGYFQNQGKHCPDNPMWKTFAEILVASTIYE